MPQSLVSRSSIDRERDTVAALAEQRQYERAMDWCDDRLAVAPPKSETYAWWACKRASIAATRGRQSGRLDASSAADVAAPLEQLLREYPDHPSRLFVQASVLAIQLQSITSDIVQAAIGTKDDATIDRLLRSLITIDRRFDEWNVVIQSGDSIANEDRFRLLAEVSVMRLQAAMLRMELFDEGSRDFAASSAKTISLIEKTLQSLPSGSPARLEIDLLHAQALLRARSLDEAKRLLQSIGMSIHDQAGPGDQADRWLAMIVELLLAEDNLDLAKRRLDQAYASTATSDAGLRRSLPLDMARLQWLIQSAQSQPETTRARAIEAASAWISEIEQRHDAYARRRAEALLLASVESGQHDGQSKDVGFAAGVVSGAVAPSANGVSASLLAMQGRRLLRDGNVDEAARMLTRAANAEADSNAAITLAVQAAAANVNAKRVADAVDVLVAAAMRHRDHPKSASLHLQAAVLAVRGGGDVSGGDVSGGDVSGGFVAWNATQLIDHLRTTATTWPDDPKTVGAAKAWATQTLMKLERWVDAAEVNAWTDATTWTRQETKSSVTAWLAALSRSSVGESSEGRVAQRFANQVVNALSSRDVSDDAKIPYFEAAVAGLDSGDLKQVASIVMPGLLQLPDASRVTFLQSVLAFRVGKTSVIDGEPDAWREVLTWRLMADGRTDQNRRSTIGAILSTWHGDRPPDLFSAERNIWDGQIELAKQDVRRVAEGSQSKASVWRIAARRFQASGDVEAVRIAIELWDELAAGTQQGSAAWHEAKLAAAEALIAIRDSDEAAKRLRYVLLTRPLSDAAVKQKYQALLLRAK